MKRASIFIPAILYLFVMMMNSCCDIKDEDCVCFEIYEPVCGNDGVEYSNSCYAECAGVSWEPGPCQSWEDGLVKYAGPPPVDGCGWVLQIESLLYEPYPPLSEEFRVDSLPVRLKYTKTGKRGHYCWGALKQISIFVIKRR